MSYFENKSFTEAKFRRLGIFSFFIFLALFLYGNWSGANGKDAWGNPLLPDLAQFYVAGQMAREGQIAQLYNGPLVWNRINETLGVSSEQEGTYFFYPPFVAWGCVPLTLLCYKHAAWAYFLLSLLLGLGLGWSVAKYFLNKKESATTACWLFVASVPFWRCVFYGQNGLISLAILWIFYLLWKRKSYLLCGLALSLGAYKPQLFFGVWFWLVLFGTNRARVGLAAGVALLVGIGSLTGGELWGQWLQMARLHQDLPGSAGRMHSIRNAFELWLVEGGPLFGLAWFVIATLWLAALLQARYRLQPASAVEIWLGFALLGSLLLTPRLYNYDLIMVYPLLVFWRGRLTSADSRWLFAIVVVGFYLNDLAVLIRIPLVTLLGIYCFLKLYKFNTPESRYRKVRRIKGR